MAFPVQDHVLWKSYREGDKQALGMIVERHYRTLRRYGLKFMIDEATVEDCIQDLFLQLWQNRLQINDTFSVKHYLLKSLRSHIIQYLRAEKHFSHQETDWDTALPEEVDAETLLIQEEVALFQVNELKRQLDTLPAREREALYLKYYENLSVCEIAEMMNVNRQSVSNFLQKALSKLRNRWLVAPLFMIICTFF
ncbi:RNA polymerase sigma factor [Runella zeae]|jgi:RNA polymerase sigma factor (sigma-70 family)|nr:sigma-70 family RNA polymerase sigma factor [Runella zeae]